MSAGRPLIFKTNKELEKSINSYFASCWRKRYHQGEVIYDPETKEIEKEQIKPYTVEGLASFLSTSRQTLINYSKKEEFFDTIMRAKEKIQAYQAERLFDRDGVNGAKFSLINNYRDDSYRDQKEINHQNDGGSFNPSELSTDELIARANAAKQIENAS